MTSKLHEEGRHLSTRASGLVATLLCCLLALATSASAECAWVLWVNDLPFAGRERIVWVPNGAFPTYGQCQKEGNVALANLKAVPASQERTFYFQ